MASVAPIQQWAPLGIGFPGMSISVVADRGAGVRASNRTRVWYLFLVLVSGASLLPLLGIPFARYVIPGTIPAIYLVAALNLLGGSFHVAATGWFYTDPSMLAHFRARPLRYIAVPCLLVGGSAAAFHFIDPGLGHYLLVLYFCWQLWHYQKQNVGLLSFIAAGTDGVSVSPWERRTLGLAAIAGILGFFSLFNVGLPERAKEFALLHAIGGSVYLLVPVAFLVAILKNPTLRENRLRLSFFLLGTLFFVPTYIFTDELSAIFGYALAHGLQYLVFMGFVGFGKKNAIVSLVTLLVIASLGYLVLDWAMRAEGPYGAALHGAFLGAVMTHFVLDAGIWRLREPFQRGYMREKFQFVFKR